MTAPLRDSISKLRKLVQTNGPATAAELTKIIADGFEDIDNRLNALESDGSTVAASGQPSAGTAPKIID